MRSEPVPSAVGSDRPRVDKWHLSILLVPILVLIVLGNIGNALGPRWQADHPALLISFSSLIRWQMLVVNRLDWWVFLPIAMIRLLAPDPLFYLLGRHYGDRAVAWATRTYGITRAIPGLQEKLGTRGVRITLRPLVLVAPNNPICLLAGAAAMPLVEFWTLNIVGTLGRLLLIRAIGAALHDEILSVADFIARNQRWFLIASISVVVVTVVMQLRRSTGELGGLAHLADEMEADETEAG